MADQNGGANFNSHLERDFQLKQHQNQRDKSDVPGSLAVATEEPKSITNIYYDCLERIFDFLDLESLLNVARTCKRLQIAAAAKFGDDYGKKRFELCLDGNGILCFQYNEISGLKFALPFLRCFGAKISDLQLEIGYSNGQIHLQQYVNQYCANTLSHINIFCGNWNLLSLCLPIPFINVIDFEIVGYCCGLNNILPEILTFFPNIRHLAIGNVFDEDSLSIIKRHHQCSPLPHLQQLDLKGITTKYAANILRANPRLQHLTFTPRPGTTIKFGRVVKMLAGNSSISKLNIAARLTHINEVDLNRFSMQCPMIEELSLCCNFTSFTSDQAFILIIQLSSLERFVFRMNDQSEYDHLVARMDTAWKHSFHFDNRVVTYLSEREREQ